MTVPSVTFGPNGPVAPSEASIFSGVFADIDAAFGGGLNPALETPQGQLATSETAVIGNANDNFVFLANMFDPAFAFGRYQDALARIYFLTRLPAEPTVVQATCAGLPGVVIPIGALAIADDDNIYTSTAAGTIGTGGTVVIPFACNIAGAVVCPANSLNRIYQALPGWDSVNNIADGVIGRATETRAEFEGRRAASVALNSVGSLPSILGSVLAVANVLDAYATENDTNAPRVIGGYTLIANSLYVAVVGGDANAVAEAIWRKKAPGCSYNGNTTVVVQDTNSGYTPPFPSYTVKFQTPAALPILFAVTIANSAQVPSTATTQIKNAIIAAFSGADGGSRARIGSTIYASRYYGPIALLGPWAQIISLLVSSPNTPTATFTASIAGTTMTVTAVASGTLAVGQTLTDITGNLIVGTTITALGTGAGGTGTYTVSNSHTVASETMKSAKATLTSSTAQIDQVPTISAANIIVTFV